MASPNYVNDSITTASVLVGYYFVVSQLYKLTSYSAVDAHDSFHVVIYLDITPTGHFDVFDNITFCRNVDISLVRWICSASDSSVRSICSARDGRCILAFASRS